jgi:hypothetical protein
MSPNMLQQPPESAPPPRFQNRSPSTSGSTYPHLAQWLDSNEEQNRKQFVEELRKWEHLTHPGLYPIAQAQRIEADASKANAKIALDLAHEKLRTKILLQTKLREQLTQRREASKPSMLKKELDAEMRLAVQHRTRTRSHKDGQQGDKTQGQNTHSELHNEPKPIESKAYRVETKTTKVQKIWDPSVNKKRKPVEPENKWVPCVRPPWPAFPLEPEETEIKKPEAVMRIANLNLEKHSKRLKIDTSPLAAKVGRLEAEKAEPMKPETKKPNTVVRIASPSLEKRLKIDTTPPAAKVERPKATEDVVRAEKCLPDVPVSDMPTGEALDGDASCGDEEWEKVQDPDVMEWELVFRPKQ